MQARLKRFINGCEHVHGLKTENIALGGSVWESNPPFDPLRTESPALKAGEVTGPLSPPLWSIAGEEKRPAVAIDSAGIIIL